MYIEANSNWIMCTPIKRMRRVASIYVEYIVTFPLYSSFIV